MIQFFNAKGGGGGQIVACKTYRQLILIYLFWSLPPHPFVSVHSMNP